MSARKVPADLSDDYADGMIGAIDAALSPYSKKWDEDPVATWAFCFLRGCNDFHVQIGHTPSVEVHPDLKTIVYCLHQDETDACFEYKLTREDLDSPWKLMEGSYYKVPWEMLLSGTPAALDVHGFVLKTLSKGANTVIAELPPNAFKPRQPRDKKRSWHQ